MSNGTTMESEPDMRRNNARLAIENAFVLLLALVQEKLFHATLQGTYCPQCGPHMHTQMLIMHICNASN